MIVSKRCLLSRNDPDTVVPLRSVQLHPVSVLTRGAGFRSRVVTLVLSAFANANLYASPRLRAFRHDFDRRPENLVEDMSRNGRGRIGGGVQRKPGEVSGCAACGY